MQQVSYDSSIQFSKQTKQQQSVVVRRAGHQDIPALMELSYDSASESGVVEQYCEQHNREHMTSVLDRGVSFVACSGEDVIGAVLFVPIDTGYSLLKHMESAHLYVRNGRRSLSVVRALIKAVKDYSTENNIVMFMHQVSYPTAIAGEKAQTTRVAALYKYFGLEGSYGASYVVRPGQP
ncbi:MAG: hypothetical protein RIC14_03375 [Filomicrobium sp.]